MSRPEYHLTIKGLPEELRPRERMQAMGTQALSSTELLAILIGTGTLGESALELAQRLLQEPGGLRHLAEVPLDQLCRVKGIGVAKAARIKAAVEVGKRLACLGPETRSVIRSLNTKNQVMAVETISIGTLNSSLVHPREVFKSAVLKSAAAMILVHNHPSGDPAPSKEDLEITRRLAEVGKLIGIEVLDHIIIGDHVFISLKERDQV
jgi:DNA repair protein RadC